MKSPPCSLFLPLLSFASFMSPARADRESRPELLADVAITELARREVWQAGRRLTYIRIAPPILVGRPSAPVSPALMPTPEQIAAEDVRAAKIHVNVPLIGAVYFGDVATPTVTEIRWLQRVGASDDASALERRFGVEAVRQLRAFVPLDLRHVDALSQLETETHVFSFSVFLSPVELASLTETERPPELALFSGAAPAPAYVFDGSEADAKGMEPTLLGLELLLAYALENRDALARDFAAQEAANTERAREAALNPPRPQNHTVYFWKSSSP